MEKTKFIKTVKYWLFPEGIINLYKEIKAINWRGRILCNYNSVFRGIHQGKRCFILCNGPSIKKQNLLLLKNEIVFSVSSGYHHKDYLTIQPKYHCIPQFSCSKYLRPKDVISWFKEMHAKIGKAELFLDVTQEPLIRKNKLFPGRNINYVYSGFFQKENSRKVIDISKKIPWITTAPVLCMMIAMYMGFKEVYLLGIDNDFWKIGEYNYFFEPTVLKGKNESADPDGKMRDPLYCQFLAFGSLLKQYWLVHNIARSNGVKIINATEGGALEEFPRVKFESLFLK